MGPGLRLRRGGSGQGTTYLPEYHAATPDTVWHYYGLTADGARAAGMNSQMFNSFLDGTKSALEMAAIANATGLEPPLDGLLFPPCGMDNLGVAKGEDRLARLISGMVVKWHVDGRIVKLEKEHGLESTPFAKRMHEFFLNEFVPEDAR